MDLRKEIEMIIQSELVHIKLHQVLDRATAVSKIEEKLKRLRAQGLTATANDLANLVEEFTDGEFAPGDARLTPFDRFNVKFNPSQSAGDDMAGSDEGSVDDE